MPLKLARTFISHGDALHSHQLEQLHEPMLHRVFSQLIAENGGRRENVRLVAQVADTPNHLPHRAMHELSEKTLFVGIGTRGSVAIHSPKEATMKIAHNVQVPPEHLKVDELHFYDVDPTRMPPPNEIADALARNGQLVVGHSDPHALVAITNQLMTHFRYANHRRAIEMHREHGLSIFTMEKE